jgi:hypothetical protein
MYKRGQDVSRRGSYTSDPPFSSSCQVRHHVPWDSSLLKTRWSHAGEIYSPVKDSSTYVRGPQPLLEAKYDYTMRRLHRRHIIHRCWLDDHECVVRKVYLFNYYDETQPMIPLRVLNFPGRLVTCHVSEAWNCCAIRMIRWRETGS